MEVKLKVLLKLFSIFVFVTVSHAAKSEVWIMYEGTFRAGYEIFNFSGNFKKTYTSGQECLSKQLEGITNDPSRTNSSGSNFNVLRSVVNGEYSTAEFADAFLINGTRGTMQVPAFRACIRIE